MPSSYRSYSQAAYQSNLITRNLGIVSQRVLHWWKMLPPNVQSGYDVEDMIADVALHIHKQRKKYDRTRVKESTWVWWVAERECLTILAHYQRKKLSAETVELSNAKHLSIPSFERRKIAFDAVERVIEFGSDRVVEFVDRLLNGFALREKRFYKTDGNGTWIVFGQEGVLIGLRGELKAGSPDLLSMIQDLRNTFARCHASLDDFRIVMTYAS